MVHYSYRLVFNVKVLNDFLISYNDSMDLVMSSIKYRSNNSFSVSVLEVLELVLLVELIYLEWDQGFNSLYYSFGKRVFRLLFCQKCKVH